MNSLDLKELIEKNKDELFSTCIYDEQRTVLAEV